MDKYKKVQEKRDMFIQFSEEEIAEMGWEQNQKLSVEITDKHPRTENGLFKLSGNTGSLRYMAPEVALEKAYNHKVDVYSYGILLWQVSGGPCVVSFVLST
jgi:serine/threonine protein kinase